MQTVVRLIISEIFSHVTFPHVLTYKFRQNYLPTEEFVCDLYRSRIGTFAGQRPVILMSEENFNSIPSRCSTEVWSTIYNFLNTCRFNIVRF